VTGEQAGREFAKHNRCVIRWTRVVKRVVKRYLRGAGHDFAMDFTFRMSRAISVRVQQKADLERGVARGDAVGNHSGFKSVAEEAGETAEAAEAAEEGGGEGVDADAGRGGSGGGGGERALMGHTQGQEIARESQRQTTLTGSGGFMAAGSHEPAAIGEGFEHGREWMSSFDEPGEEVVSCWGLGFRV